ncbi:MAG: murein L,D-transpeptidase catalytic domain family protein [Algoriphagus sp.]|nr:murein L,D-transpeptidase catalytic domain family protein [Algoriphagus sp.]
MITPNILIPFLWMINLSDLSTEIVKSTATEVNEVEILYNSLSENSSQLPSREVLELAMEGWEKLEDDLKSPILTVIDFSLPSTEKRLWVIDPAKGLILHHSVVAHGRNSGELLAKTFSNQPESFQSSLGFYKTAETYQGKHGYSLRLDGLEKGFNDQARNRAIVIHGADYAKEEFAKTTGRLGRSLGCPALPPELSEKVIDLIKDGSLLFIYGNDQSYLQQSYLLQP